MGLKFDGDYLLSLANSPWVGKIPWRRKWQPTAVFLPGKSGGFRSLVGYSPWGRKESDRTEQLHFDNVKHPTSSSPSHVRISRFSSLRFSLSLIIDRMFLVLTSEPWLWVNDCCSNKDTELIQVNMLLIHITWEDRIYISIDSWAQNSQFAFCNWGSGCSLPFFFFLTKVQHLSRTKFIDYLLSGLLLTSVCLSECLIFVSLSY